MESHGHALIDVHQKLFHHDEKLYDFAHNSEGLKLENITPVKNFTVNFTYIVCFHFCSNLEHVALKLCSSKQLIKCCFIALKYFEGMKN